MADKFRPDLNRTEGSNGYHLLKVAPGRPAARVWSVTVNPRGMEFRP